MHPKRSKLGVFYIPGLRLSAVAGLNLPGCPEGERGARLPLVSIGFSVILCVVLATLAQRDRPSGGYSSIRSSLISGGFSAQMRLASLSVLWFLPVFPLASKENSEKTDEK